jgi:hypothetical protein
MALSKTCGKCPCKSMTVIVKMRASLSSTRSEKDIFRATVPYYIGNVSLCQILLVMFLSLRTNFTCHHQITIHTSKYFLVNVWSDFGECDINFIFKCVFNLGSMEFRAPVPVHETLPFSYFQRLPIFVRAVIFSDRLTKLLKVNNNFVISVHMEQHHNRTDLH